MTDTIFSFDVGIASLGVAVRRDLNILEAQSLLIPEDFASTEDARSRRRMMRTREAHKAREEWWRKVCADVGIPVLLGRSEDGSRKGDPRLEREFPICGNDTIYTSSLLRIALLEGQTLEGWQVFKAIHSALQRRGYDSSLPWKHKHGDGKASGKKSAEEEAETQEKTDEFHASLVSMSADPKHHLCCYYDAWKMGLWNPLSGIKSLRIDHNAERARKYTPSRDIVENELRLLLAAAAKYHPALTRKIDYILYGPAEKAYASYDNALRRQFNLKLGGKTDWQGILSQKIPRFDNRIVDQCALIPRLHVCSADDGLAIQASFLLQLKNLRYFTPDHKTAMLSANDIQELLNQAIDEAKKAKAKAPDKMTREKTANAFKLTKTKWTRWLDKKGYGRPVLNNEEVDEPKISGRSRFSRPALRILRDLILSGDSPHRLHASLIADTRRMADYGVVKDDIAFLLRMPESWEQLHIPAVPLADRLAGKTGGDALADCRCIIGTQNNPRVRHRLGVFLQTLLTLQEKYGTPNKVVIEFIREDFMGEEAKRRLAQFQKRRELEWRNAKEDAAKEGLSGKETLTKLQLLKQQGGECLYTGDTLAPSSIEDYEIDHVVPRHGQYNGSDSMFNKVLTKRKTNQDKGDRTPYQFLQAQGKWHAYLERIDRRKADLGRKKVALLSCENPAELDEKYTSLAETAWIARLSRDIACRLFGWQPGAKGEEQRVIIVNGNLTARIRRRYRLDGLLAPAGVDPETIEKKCRDDDRHHALDAMVISYIPQWARDPQLRDKLLLPWGIDREFFRKHIDAVMPRKIAFEQPHMEETIYAAKQIEGEPVTTIRRELAKHFEKTKDEKLKAEIENVFDNNFRQHLLVLLEKHGVTGFRAQLHDLRFPTNGPLVKKAVFVVGKSLAEYADLSKEKTGQYFRWKQCRGYLFHVTAKSKGCMRRVYAHESLHAAKQELQQAGSTIVGFFFPGCVFSIERNTEKLVPGIYTLQKINSGNSFVIALPNTHSVIASTNSLIQAGITLVK